MGWWEVESLDKKLIVGDEPIDLAYEMLNRIRDSYQEDVNRKPLLAELIKVIEMVLQFHLEEYVADYEDQVVVKLQLKTKKKPKQQAYEAGSVFAVPLEGFGFGFGKVLQVLPSKIFVGFFGIYSEHLLTLQELKKYPYVLEIFCGDFGLTGWEWKVIGYSPLEPADAEIPDFYWIDPIDADHIEIIKAGQWDNRVPASREDIQGLQRYALSGYKSAEYKLIEVLQKSKS